VTIPEDCGRQPLSLSSLRCACSARKQRRFQEGAKVILERFRSGGGPGHGFADYARQTISDTVAAHYALRTRSWQTVRGGCGR
jgi:hypothetical protein